MSKSDIAMYLNVLGVLRSELASLEHISIAFAVTCDEGSGGDNGAGYLLQSMKLRPGLAIFSGISDAVTVAHNGCIQLKIQLQGAACHQSLVPSSGDTIRQVSIIADGVYSYAETLKGVASTIPGLYKSHIEYH